MTLSLLFFTRFRAVSLLILGAGLLAQGQSNAAIRYVRANGTNNNPATATTWATSTTNLQGAINASNPGDQVWVATGTYKPGGNANTDRTISFTMKNGVTIYGGFASSGSPTLAQRNPTSFTTVLSGDIGTSGSNTDNTIFIIKNNGLAATAVLDGFVIRDGNSGGQSFADYASGMYNYSSSPLVTNCSFQNNSGYYGAAMSNRFNSNPAVTNCSFQNNSAEAYGGGMYNDESSPTVTNCSFQGNSAYEGGGMSNSGRSGSLAVTNCSFQRNSATQGGAMVNYSTTVSLTNCVVFGNGEANTIVNSFGSITASYSLFEPSVTGYVDGGNNLTTSTSPFLSNTDARLNVCSSAINTGLNSANATTTDLAGNPRLFNSGRIDRGAYEYQAAPTITTTAPSVSTATIGVAFSQPFTASGGTSPYSYSLVSGSLPTGLSLAPTGVLSGTPTQSGSFTITVRGRDISGCSDVSEPYRLTVSERASVIRYVKAGGAGNRSGNSWADASDDLQSQIDFAGAQQVWVAQGTYKPGGTANTDRTLSFAMRNGVSILGGFAAGGTPTLAQRNPGSFTTVLSGDIGTIGSNADNSYHVVNNGGLTATAVLDGFIIRDGKADNDYGSGRNNGGGMYNNSSSPTVINCSFLSNSAVYGGGMFNQGGSPGLTNCSFVSNSGFYGGGINNSQSSPGLTNCSFLSNSASAGGGIFNFNSNPSLTNCVLYGNGGAKTFANGNSSTSATYSLLETSITGYSGDNNLTTTVSPFVSSTDARLNGCSPAINTGLNSANTTTTDLAGNPRFFNSRIDMGAYEYQAAPTTIITTVPAVSTATVGVAFSQTFTAMGGTSPYSYSVASGSLPAGLSLATTGVLSGTPTQTGSFTITVQGRDATGCSGISAAYVLTVSEPASVMLTGLAATPNAVCTGSVATFTATVGNVTGSYSYTLTNGLSTPLTGSASGTLFSQAIPAGGTGTQRFTLTVTANGQSASGETPLTVNPLPVASLTNNGPLSCAQSSVTLTANGGSSYTFVSGSGVLGTPGATNTVVVSSAGTYSVTVANGNGCSAVASTSVSSNTALATPTLLTQSGQSAVSVDLNTGPVTLLADGCAGTIQWMGSNGTSGTGSPISVPTSQPGTFIYQATCQLGSCTSPPASATVTVGGARLTVLHRDVDNYADNNAIQPVLIVQNQGGGALPLSAITLRYYLTVENFMPLTNLFINYAQVGAANVQARYVPLDQPRQGAFGYVEYRFTEGAGQLASGQDSGPIQGYIAKSDYGGLYEPDDYSYAPERDKLLANPRITAYYNGVLLWGQEPPLLTPQRALRVFTESKNGPSATAITTNLDLRNEGNLPVNYADLRIRYYFTADNQSGLTFYSDFMGEGALQGQLVTINPPLANADTYLEIRPSFSGQLMPLSHLGVLRYSIYSPQGARLDQTNDYSYQEQPAEFSPNSHVVVYVGNERVWGQEPGTNARLATQEPATALSVEVLGNPVTGGAIELEVRGAAEQPLRLQVTDIRGRVVSERSLERAQAVERQTLPVEGQPAGLLLLRVSTPGQTQTIKVLKR